ncbi:CG33632, partial [Drosophila busckii]
RALLLLLVGGTAWAINIRYTGLKCQSVDTTYCIIEHCVMKPMRRGVKQVTGVVKLLKLPVSNISLTLQLQRRGQSKQILYSVSIDGCKFWDTKRRNPIANALYKYFRFDAYTNMNHSCPYNLIMDIGHRGQRSGLYSVSIDGCKFFENKRKNPFALGMYQAYGIGIYSNLNHTCPYNHDIIVHNALVEESLKVQIPFSHAASTVGYKVKFTGIECRTVDKSFCNVQKCEMKAVSRGVKEISIYVKMLQVPVSNLTVGLKVKRRAHSARPMYQVIVDGCKFIQTTRRNPVANAVYKFLKFDTYSNLNHSCPYDHDLIMDRMRVDDSLSFQMPIGLGSFVIQTHWFAYNVLRGTININVEFMD